LLERLGGACVWDSIGTIYREGKPMIASLASIVFEASRLGDPDATAIIERNAEYLASLLNCGVNTYKARPTAVLSGGLIEHYGDILLPRIRAHTSVELLLIDLPPVFGACRAACHLISEQCPKNFYQNFKESYRG
jgi:N-acetylglucosamine kinase-like BadF-type ATPase